MENLFILDIPHKSYYKTQLNNNEYLYEHIYTGNIKKIKILDNKINLDEEKYISYLTNVKTDSPKKDFLNFFCFLKDYNILLDFRYIEAENPITQYSFFYYIHSFNKEKNNYAEWRFDVSHSIFEHEDKNIIMNMVKEIILEFNKFILYKSKHKIKLLFLNKSIKKYILQEISEIEEVLKYY